MRALIVRAHGAADTLKLDDVADPAPGPGEVLVRVAACAVNHLDVWVRRGVPGHTFPLPLILGNDVAGTVAAVGPGVDDLELGTEVVVAPGVSCGHCVPCYDGRDHHCRQYSMFGEHRDGGCAQLMVAPRANIFAKPQGLTAPQAAALGVAFLTAWHMLVERAALQLGETVLVQGAGSGVGTSAIQIAKLFGAQVIAAASTEAKLERAAELGADHCLLSGSEDLAKQTKMLTAGEGAHVVFEHVGAATWEQSMRALAWQGRLVTCGATSGATVELQLRHLFFKSQSILGATMGSKASFARILQQAERGTLRPVIDRILPLSEAAQAHALLEDRQVFGKVVLTPPAS